MDGYYDTRLLSRLRRSYDDRRNTLTWALFIWAVGAVGFTLFLPFNAAMVRAIALAVGWSALHLFRKM
ncbi:MAG TPA: hypothetical protein VGI45_24025 [Terracidiphilus sp.]|jgi:dolichol kinase